MIIVKNVVDGTIKEILTIDFCVIAGIDGDSLLQAVEMNNNGD